MTTKRKFFYGFFFLLVYILGLAIFFMISTISYKDECPRSKYVHSFQECVDAGFPVMESYPRQCATNDGRHFVEEIEEEKQQEEGEFYGSSTYYPCELNEDCLVSGCNAEICQGLEEESMASVCLLPEGPLPSDLGYSCGCFEYQCQWGK